MASHEGKTTRRPRQTNTPDQGQGDEGTRIEAEMAATGRDHLYPRERLVGAHEERVSGGAISDVDEDTDDLSAEGEEPTGPGSDVAPTARAAAREQERHRLEREIGRVPAAEDGQIRERRAPGVTREALDRAADEADRRVAGHSLGRRQF